MNKFSKIVFTTGLLSAISASCVYASSGTWVKNDADVWNYVNKNGETVTSDWVKYEDKWFYLDESGEIAADSLIEDGDDYYYVGGDGVMIKNQWVAIDNEDYGDDDQPEVWWYYFGSNGKAYRNNGSNERVYKKQINGKTYCFDEDGKMQYGWVGSDGVRNTDENAFEDCEYYFGDENDGAMTIGWREIALTDVADAETDQPGDSYWDEDQVRWFWFKSSGKKQKDKDNKAINGKKYGFDSYGRMIADWHTTEDDYSLADASKRGSATRSEATASSAYAKTFSYYSSPEDGARYTKGWFKVVAGYYLNYNDYDDDSEKWYYADGNGKLVAGQIKSIKGKKYAFDLKGGMISGLAILETDKNEIYQYLDSDGTYSYCDGDSFDETAKELFVGDANDYHVYYFGNDGEMRLGAQKVDIDGETFDFYFEKSGSNKGEGLTGEREKKYYLGGKLVKADSENKISILNTETFEKMSVNEFINENSLDGVEVTSKTGKASKGDVVFYNGDNYNLKDISKKYVVINESGSVVKSGTKKDADGFKVVVTNKVIEQIYNE